ncbi:MEMO1 family protein [Methylomarinovum caldicuralii]|uniref:MEMO1 family protein MIT9_P1302 n=1 Tax=Methylomarinovum caldicuralii TaxID=438856 RepID=A0AAU9CB47_9GAMM|nr:AmmeMemoRadiSam system protein B [Methylomarinovum caldicuralii]BCX81724.1 MEMO1 family protein [Methylomarinovum caldicuralii]
MTSLRYPAVAGMFYPEDPVELDEMIRTFLASAAVEGPVPKAIIAPHAGYIYSGPVAASVYRLLLPAKDVIKRVVLLGPAHRVPFRGLAVPSVDFFITPLGTVAVDKAALAKIADLPFVHVSDLPHEPEHSLEVHLPFLQEVLEDFKVVPIVVGDATPEEVAQVLERLWGGPETLIVVSSDLSHYYDYETARRLDSATSRAIEELDPTRLNYESACGRIPVAGLLLAARKHGLRAKTVDLRNSGDTAGPKDQVVGYGAYAFF